MAKSIMMPCLFKVQLFLSADNIWIHSLRNGAILIVLHETLPVAAHRMNSYDILW